MNEEILLDDNMLQEKGTKVQVGLEVEPEKAVVKTVT